MSRFWDQLPTRARNRHRQGLAALGGGADGGFHWLLKYNSISLDMFGLMFLSQAGSVFFFVKRVQPVVTGSSLQMKDQSVSCAANLCSGWFLGVLSIVCTNWCFTWSILTAFACKRTQGIWMTGGYVPRWPPRTWKCSLCPCLAGHGLRREKNWCQYVWLWTWTCWGKHTIHWFWTSFSLLKWPFVGIAHFQTNPYMFQLCVLKKPSYLHTSRGPRMTDITKTEDECFDIRMCIYIYYIISIIIIVIITLLHIYIIYN